MSMASGAKKIVTGTYTPTADIASFKVQIPHNLGVRPDFIIAFADGIASDASFTEFYIVTAVCTKINATSPQTTKGHQMICQATRPTWDQIQIKSQNDDGTKYLNENWVKIPFYNSDWQLKAGVTYRYVFGLYE